MRIANWWMLALAVCCLGADWKTAEPGWIYQFPRDHHVHPDFKTEWWYFTGNLTNQSGRRFGYELTFFRQGIRPPDERGGTTSRFVVDDLKFAHFTVTDAAEKQFRFYDKVSRGSFGEAGFGNEQRLAWIQNWTIQMASDGAFDLVANAADAAVKLHLVPQKKPIIHGSNGISRKAKAAGHASHYYSITRLTTNGTLRTGRENSKIEGESWFDHEWATNQLASNQVGWNWVSAQFDDGSELMLYEMRLTNGSIDPVSNGTIVQADGSYSSLTSAEFQMKPLSFWLSPTTKAKYPIAWHVKVPRMALEFEIRPVLENQELVFTPLTYWEGAFDIVGTRNGKPLGGHGYLELTGFASPLEELNR
ncbi:MAG TPA: lipocalin-like domain-containing protein [Chthoniobacterales bacterium]